jgi:20S proteasome subunit beta 4
VVPGPPFVEHRSVDRLSRFRYYCLSILDKHHHPDISFEQGMKILRMCTDELQRRLPIDFKGMVVKVVRKGGIEEIEYDMSKQVVSA